MRFKLDENLEGRLTALLTARGHEADSVLAEGLGGASDERLFAKCAEDRRVLVTLDLDFADPLRFPPAGGPGIMVLRPRRNTLAMIRETLTAALPALERDRIEGALWIVGSRAGPHTRVPALGQRRRSLIRWIPGTRSRPRVRKCAKAAPSIPMSSRLHWSR
ncbi:MAG: DUF5615 family PIN-like protein [Betaproteobacteria bacterium]|nr:DUF5615 family PIN-like protein [Betaproteobacteria bacterium]